VHTGQCDQKSFRKSDQNFTNWTKIEATVNTAYIYNVTLLNLEDFTNSSNILYFLKCLWNVLLPKRRIFAQSGAYPTKSWLDQFFEKFVKNYTYRWENLTDMCKIGKFGKMWLVGSAPVTLWQSWRGVEVDQLLIQTLIAFFPIRSKGNERRSSSKNLLRRSKKKISRIVQQRAPGLPDGLFSNKNSNLGKFWRALECKMWLYFIIIRNIFSVIWYNLWPFGIVCIHFVYFSRFGMFGPRKIWQPWRVQGALQIK
jgi:hypothetical protein